MGYIAEITDYEVLDPGVYPATFISVTPRDDDPFGPDLEWAFSVFTDEITEVEITGRSGTSFGPNTKARECAKALLGRPLQQGERIDFRTLFGTRCQLLLEVVEKEKGSFNRIIRVLPAPKASAADDFLF